MCWVEPAIFGTAPAPVTDLNRLRSLPPEIKKERVPALHICNYLCHFALHYAPNNLRYIF